MNAGIGHTGLRELFNFFILDGTGLYQRYRIATKSTRAAHRTNTVLTTQVVFVENSAKSPTAYRKQNCTIRNKWKFRNDMRCTIRTFTRHRIRILLLSNERSSIYSCTAEPKAT